MMKIDSIESIQSKGTRKKSRGRGRLVRSLEFTSKSTTRANQRGKGQQKKPNASASIWRDPAKNVLSPSCGFTTHKMSSVTNNFMSDDLETESEIDEVVVGMVGDLDPGRGTLVFAQHDEVFRSSPLSTSSSFIPAEEQDEQQPFDHFEQTGHNTDFYTEGNENFYPSNNTAQTDENHDVGMAWNPKQNKWVPLIYRYVFPASAFNQTSSSSAATNNSSSIVSWSLNAGKSTTSAATTGHSFKFPPPKKSIMMGPDGLVPGSGVVDADAREACEKLLELIDDENLMLPVRTSLRSSSPTVTITAQPTLNQGRTILSEWSSLPSSPPPPIFHDVCNRPIPELRLSPPLTGKSLGKRLFANAISAPSAISASPCESPLTKRLRFSSSSSSIV